VVPDFHKRKTCGTINTRGCADGRSQREYMTKSETSSLTVSLDAMMLCCAIDAKEKGTWWELIYL